MDELVYNVYGPSWVENVNLAGIKYWVIAALDPGTSMSLGSPDTVDHCFNAPTERLRYRGKAERSEGYRWGSHHWLMTTWNKVHIIREVYNMGFHVIHSDADVTWFKDPLPFFSSFLGTNKHTLFVTDMTTSYNEKGPAGITVERESHPYVNINTGVYWVQQWDHGRDFFNEWVKWQDRNIGHDQDGLNFVARGSVFRGDRDMPNPVRDEFKHPRMFYMAHNSTAGISFLPGSMFANAYTYVNTRLHEALEHPLYAVHWVWGGSTLESKRQNMRDALRFHDPDTYYTEPNLLSFDLSIMPTPDGFNTWPDARTEEMIRFHVAAANDQLHQAYWAFAAAVSFNRTVLIPKFQCFCSKNWYMTHACRINGEHITQFPFVCALSQLMRVKRLHSQPVRVRDLYNNGQLKVAHIREYSFLKNPKVPAELRTSRVIVSPLPLYVRPPSASMTVLQGAVSAKDLGNGTVVVGLPWPLDDQELIGLMEPYKSKRVIHVTNATTLIANGFKNPQMWTEYDSTIGDKVTHWCCRSPADMKRLKLPERIQLEILPPSRRKQPA